MNGSIFKIQSYSTKDGPGIRSTVFAIGCNLRCKWCSNPELIEPGQKILYHADKCVKCGSCVKCANLDERAAACFHDAYERIGMTLSAEELASKLLRDKVFYEQSGGGVTFSGGEPALQSDFFIETAMLLKKEYIHVALDTAGNISWNLLAPLVETIDLALYDIKAFDNAIHESFTGVGNTCILENARLIAAMKKPMIIRLILVPGVNDMEEELDRRLTFVRDLGSAVKRIDFIKYHRLGEGKYQRLGLQYPLRDTPNCSDDFASYAVCKARSFGLAASIGG